MTTDIDQVHAWQEVIIRVKAIPTINLPIASPSLSRSSARMGPTFDVLLEAKRVLRRQYDGCLDDHTPLCFRWMLLSGQYNSGYSILLMVIMLE